MHDRDAVTEERAVHADRLRRECDLRDKDDRAAPRLKNAVDHRLDNESLSASRDPVKERGGGDAASLFTVTPTAPIFRRKAAYCSSIPALFAVPRARAAAIVILPLKGKKSIPFW